MSELTSRRKVLGGLFLGGIFGVEACVFGPASSSVSLPEGMLERMAALDKDGVVFVVPDDVDEHRRFGRAIQRLLGPVEQSPLETLLMFITLNEPILGVAAAAAVGVGADQQLVLLSPDGRRLATGPLDLSSPITITASLRALLDLEPYASQRKARLPNDEATRLREAVGRRGWQGGNGPRDTEVSRMASAFVDEVRAMANTEGSGRSAPEDQALIRNLPMALAMPLSPSLEQQGYAPVVFGVIWDFHQPPEACPMCGMMSSPGLQRRFVDFAASDESNLPADSRPSRVVALELPHAIPEPALR